MVAHVVAVDAIDLEGNGIVLVVVVHVREDRIGEFMPCRREFPDDGIIPVTIDFHAALERQRAAYHVGAAGDIQGDMHPGSVGKGTFQRLGIVGHAIAHGAVLLHRDATAVQASKGVCRCTIIYQEINQSGHIIDAG